MMTDPVASSPIRIRPVEDFNRHLADGRFMLLRSRSGQRPMYPPRVAEPLTGATDLEWVPASGLGTVYATSVMRERPPKLSYNVALIDLDDGPRMMSRVEGLAPEAVTIGLRVVATIIEEDGRPLVVFRPA
jgi:uncharacterized OB-fold protein